MVKQLVETIPLVVMLLGIFAYSMSTDIEKRWAHMAIIAYAAGLLVTLMWLAGVRGR